jgi:hypothetical protein
VYPWRTRFLCLVALAVAPVLGQSDEPKKAAPDTKVAPAADTPKGAISPPPAVPRVKPRTIETDEERTGDTETPKEAQFNDPTVKVSGYGVTDNKLKLRKGQISKRITLEWTGDAFDYSYPPSLTVIESRNEKAKKIYLNVVGDDDATFELVAVAAGTKDGKTKLSNIVRVEITVGAGGIPKGVAPPPPLPPGAAKLLVVIVEETSKPFDNRVDVIDVVKKWAKDNGHWAGFVDKDEVTRTGSIPKHLADPFRRATDKQLPQLVIYENKGQIGEFMDIQPLPTDPDEAVKLLTKYVKK